MELHLSFSLLILNRQSFNLADFAAKGQELGVVMHRRKNRTSHPRSHTLSQSVVIIVAGHGQMIQTSWPKNKGKLTDPRGH